MKQKKKKDERFSSNAWEWPDTLRGIMGWASERHVDVFSFKTDRQALFMIARLAKLKMKFPKQGKSCVPLLVIVQEKVLGTGKGSISEAVLKHREVSRVHGMGTFGAAGECRKVSIDEYLSDKNSKK